MPKFPPNTGFKMPGIGSKEVNSPSNFRDDHHVDKMGYCDTTPSDMLPSGSSPLKYSSLIDDDPYTSVRYTPGSLDASDAFEGKKPVKQELDNIAKKDDGNGNQTSPADDGKGTSKVNINYEPPASKVKGRDTKVPDLVKLGKKDKKTDKGAKTDKVYYTDLPESVRDAARKYNIKKHGTHNTTGLAKATGGKKGKDTSFTYTGDRDEAMRKKRKQMGY